MINKEAEKLKIGGKVPAWEGEQERGKLVLVEIIPNFSQLNEAEQRVKRRELTRRYNDEEAVIMGSNLLDDPAFEGKVDADSLYVFK